jgi:hypothetical protein
MEKEQITGADGTKRLPLKVHPETVTMLAEVLAVASKHYESYREANLKSDEHSPSSVVWELLECIADLAGLPEYKNPSLREDYDGPGDYCRDWFYFDTGDAQTHDDFVKIIKTCAEQSVYRTDEDEEWYLNMIEKGR